MFRLIPAFLALLLLPSIALAQTGGPDAGGYFYGPASFDFVDISSSGTALTPDDNVAVTLPWDFPWYGVDYGDATVGLHGGLRFGSGDIDGSPSCLPDTGAAPDIAAYWADVSLDGGEVYSFHDTVADRFIVSWQGVEVGFGGSGDFQLQLFPDGRVELHWDDLDWQGGNWDNGNTASVGIQDRAGGSAGALSRSCFSSSLSSDTALWFETCVDADGDGDYDEACGGGDCDDNDPDLASTLPELCDGIDNNCDGVIGELDTVFDDEDNTVNSDRLRGNMVLADADGTLTGIEQWIAPSGDATLTWTVYEGLSANGTYSPIAQTSTTVPAGDAAWQSSGTLAAPIRAGRYYALAVHMTGDAVTYYYDTFPSLPSAISWGAVQTGLRIDGIGTTPATLNGGADTTTQWGYYARYAFEDELDVDGDGLAPCDGDCDDTDAAVLPGALEICDGVDNDCDGVIADIELDGDGDGLASCEGDCDDADAAAYPGNPEVCDGADNDCDGAIPSNEADADADGSLACDDCDDGNAAIHPDAAEVCDGFDNNCDGITGGLLAETQETTGSSSGGDRSRGNFWRIDDTVTTGSFEMLLDATPGTELTWSVFESAFQGGSYVLLDSWDTTTTLSGNDWHSSGAHPVTLEGGSFYALVVGWSDSVTYNWRDFGVQFPQEFGFGAAVAGISVQTASPSSLDGADDDINVSYAFRINTGPEDDDDADGSPVCADCDDADPINFPGNPEVCDGFDNDCDPATDDAVDGDGDGVTVCDGDCDDSNDDVLPAHPEICDGLDNDCDGVVPADEADADADGYTICAGDCDDTLATTFPGAFEACDGLDNDCDPATESIGGEADDDGDGSPVCADCDDADASAFPGNSESCDGVDNDCDPATDEGEDGDGDGQTACDGDCDDADAANYPGNTELCDGQDNDCNGAADADAAGELDDDADGSFSCADCDDADPTAFPGNLESCDGVDNDCDGALWDQEGDEDGDGSPACADCDDDDAANFPGNIEACDEQDNDCDGAIGPDEIDDDGDGATECDGDCDDDDVETGPGFEELCDGFDNDCDGTVEDDELDVDGDGFMPCAGDCDDELDTVYPDAEEVCDGLDSDCDGEIPADEVDADADGVPVCAGDCDDEDPAIHPDAPEICDGIDQDCDGTVKDEYDDVDGDGASPCEGDCDDTDDTVYEGAEELCDGLDQDCDGVVPDDEFDLDGDGVAPCAGDCDDEDASVSPLAEEACDGVDTDCDGELPEDELDEDGDGFFECDGDCDDALANLNPDRPEDSDAACVDGVDNDCDGDVDSADSDCPEVPVEGGLSGTGCNCDTSASASPGWFGLLLLLGVRRRRR